MVRTLSGATPSSIVTKELFFSLDPFSNIPCAWCGISMIRMEAQLRKIEGTNTYYVLCGYCSGFHTKTEMEAKKARVVGDAINPELSDSFNYPWI
jgi:hypothetical protein